VTELFDYPMYMKTSKPSEKSLKQGRNRSWQLVTPSLTQTFRDLKLLAQECNYCVEIHETNFPVVQYHSSKLFL